MQEKALLEFPEASSRDPKTSYSSEWRSANHRFQNNTTPNRLFLITLAGLWLYLYRNLVFHRCINREFVLIQRGAGMAAAILSKDMYKQV
jgi:hypothetical protein